MARPFSNFDYVESHYQREPAIRRIFSQARMHHAQSFAVEDIEADGLVADENAEIHSFLASYQMTGLQRLSFWTAPNDAVENGNINSENLVGYAVVKKDRVPSRQSLANGSWHVFESVIRKYPDRHNYIPANPKFPVVFGTRQFQLQGALYCQQNGLNKSCAQVAIRSLLATISPELDISYSQLNAIARNYPPLTPSEGLSVQQISGIFDKLGMKYTAIEYGEDESSSGGSDSPTDRAAFPYQKFLYAGVEAGAGALLGFRRDAAEPAERSHIIPFFGHTFNSDTWVVNADSGYFSIGEAIRYIPSDAWVNSFIGHDDNYGSNFCVPRLYVKPQNVGYVLALHKAGFGTSGIEAEAIGSEYVYALLGVETIKDSTNPWLRRLVAFADQQRVVIRAVPLTRDEYVSHLNAAQDWEWNREHSSTREVMRAHLPERLWMIEVSLPELFPANHRKLGSILLNGDGEFGEDLDLSEFVFAQFPSIIVFARGLSAGGTPEFTFSESNLKSHIPVYPGE
ncbi:MAG TPA: hypothetical protein VN634_07290 [Candidatus Limnocylindrales bacterium]|nr:hypothetical protein [Candidatus Limnocylindrales bacterium]